ncbi:electron transporter [Streptomyces sp. CB00316]|uniref:DM13 domain-containing protein n=1 Tax=unclassified Streptomyces TaxID=2593676 RepID=UPI000938A003|nr:MULTISPECIES: DM13 domain-containing protein [unclassified Streptomyces]MBT2424654.1 DM13 domain-containing protein [Streptomyces sp. ISL-112]MBT2465327.1 DM13 domain-containing protein [Streptomyces sp. ISL-63]OKJ19127.1 electron transporter [Streptomyces sp. CB00316]
MVRKGRTSKLIVTGIAVAVVTAVVAGLYLFQPWKLWQDETVLESLPSPAVTLPAEPASPGGSPAPPTGPVTVAAGRFISHEHATTGAVKIVRLADGTHTLRLENLDTSNGPDLHVWLTDAPVKAGRGGWGVFDDGKYISLGKLKGNKGNQNYALPAGAELSDFTSVSVWCARFGVSFGAAELTQV